MSAEDLRAQYVELNTRSRWYASQAWQVPFAYIGLSALLLAPFVKDHLYLGITLILAALLGILVVIHLFGIFERIKATVNGMNTLEESLGLPSRSEYKSMIHGSMLILLILVLVAFLIIGTSMIYGELCIGR